jgi:hypothetical protein
MEPRGAIGLSVRDVTIGTVFGAPIPVVDPRQVDIVSHTSWVQLWLPFITAMIGSVVALFGVFWSNRTNRKAIDAADTRAQEDRKEAHDRDFRLWQRDTLLRLADEIVGAAIEADEEYGRWIALGSVHFDQEGFQKCADVIAAQGRKIGANIARLHLIGAHEAGGRAADLRRAINDRGLIGAVLEVPGKTHVTLPRATSDEDKARLKAEIDALSRLRDGMVANINTARAKFGETVEHELARTNLQVLTQPATPAPSPLPTKWAKPSRGRAPR